MKTTAKSGLLIFIVSALTVSITGCMKDNIKGKRTFTISTPVFESLLEFRANIKAEAASTIQSTGKIAVSGQYIFVSTPGDGIHVIDNSNPKAPKNISFINIPGNADIAISGNTLYADAYSDLITFDIQDPRKPITKNFVTNVFPNYGGYYLQDTVSKTYSYYYPMMMGTVSEDSLYIIKRWITKDTTVNYDYNNPYPSPIYFGCANCSYNLATAALSSTGGSKGITTSGSLSRFAITNNFLYAIAYDSLSAFDIADRFTPALRSKTFVNWGSETVFPFKDKLFIGTTNGMYMYDVQSPDKPSLLGQVQHIRSCDPVIADDDYAYVTLRDGTKCNGYTNQLDVYDINNLSSPSLLKTYTLTHPTGLSKDGNTLFICDGKDGLKVFDARDKNNLKLIKQLKDGETIDVIAYNGLAIVMTTEGINEYSYTDLNNIYLISKL